MGDEAPEVAQSQVITIGAFEKMLSSIKTRYSQLVVAKRGEDNVLHAWEAPLSLIRVINGRVEDRRL